MVLAVAQDAILCYKATVDGQHSSRRRRIGCANQPPAENERL
jgi:hypothetical protein